MMTKFSFMGELALYWLFPYILHMQQQPVHKTEETKLTRSSAAAKMEASGMVPGSQQFNRNWNLFMPCLIAPRFTMFLFFMASWLAAKRSWNPWQPCWGKEWRHWNKYKDFLHEHMKIAGEICIRWYRMSMQVFIFFCVATLKSQQDLQMMTCKFPQVTINLESWRLTRTLVGHGARDIGQRTTDFLFQQMVLTKMDKHTHTQRAGMEDGRGVYQKHKTGQVRAHTRTTERIVDRGEGKAPQGSTIFLFCVVKLGRVPPTRPPFTEPLEEILLFFSAVFNSTSLWQLDSTGELDLRWCTGKTQIKAHSLQLQLYF